VLHTTTNTKAKYHKNCAVKHQHGKISKRNKSNSAISSHDFILSGHSCNNAQSFQTYSKAVKLSVTNIRNTAKK